MYNCIIAKGRAQFWNIFRIANSQSMKFYPRHGSALDEICGEGAAGQARAHLHLQRPFLGPKVIESPFAKLILDLYFDWFMFVHVCLLCHNIFLYIIDF